MIGVLTIDELNETVERALRIESAKPILFNTADVRAILNNTKTVTRRVIRPQPVKVIPADNEIGGVVVCGGSGRARENYHAGDLLYVREAWALYSEWAPVEPDPELGMFDSYLYRATWDGRSPKWHPSIHMPKEAARIFLRVTDVKVAHIQDMTMSDMRKEGMIPPEVTGGQWQQWQRDYAKPLWNSTIKKADMDRYGWDANPWVWVIAFQRVEREEI